MDAAEQLISQARRGRFGELLPQLLALATDPAGEPDPAWEAGAAAIQILFWHDRFAEAADLAETLITRQAPLGGELCDQDVPFDDSFLAAELHAGVPAGPRMRAAAALVPPDRVLGESLLWRADELALRPAGQLLPSAHDWGGPVRSADGVIGGQLLEREFGSLGERDKPVAWTALKTTNDFPRARALVEDAGELPEEYDALLWLAGWYAVEGAVEAGERMLLAAHGRWWPYMRWDAIPDSMVLQPALRPVVTDRVREHYLTRPIGPEARSDRK
ncbi:hypothetical protein AB0D08_00815 [Kitasatospora sp. NPDC048540]|uniref:hypothetical protein n=1 Tax=unclassified Kitasatospora TaxID=2633591 RepID=UPI00053B25A3|nr:hypothetical protein [Kitasatospora sp. MBT63]